MLHSSSDCGFLLHKARSPLTDETELHAVLKAVPLPGGGWQTSRLLVSAAHCTLTAGRGDLAAPLIAAALRHSPQPFLQLAALYDDKSGGCAVDLLLSLPTTDNAKGGVDDSAIVCTALMVWHGAVASMASPRDCPGDFLRFSHRIGHALSLLARDAEVRVSLSECWLYNVLAYANRCGQSEPVTHYLLAELRATNIAQPLEAAAVHLPLDEGNACARLGLHGPQVAQQWARMRHALFVAGCARLHAAQEVVNQRAGGAVQTLRRVFAAETTQYMADFRRPLDLSADALKVLRDAAMSEELCIPRGAFAQLLAAVALTHVGPPPPPSSLPPLLSAASAAVALALRHGYVDIALEILRAECAPAPADAVPLVVWGRALEEILCAGKPTHATATAARCLSPRVANHECPLVHEVFSSRGAAAAAAAVLSPLAQSSRLCDLVPAALALLRGHCAAAAEALLRDRVAPAIALGGLTRAVQGLAAAGDAPLARCFLPLVAGIAARAVSRTGFVLALQSIAAVAECCEWTTVIAALGAFVPFVPLAPLVPLVPPPQLLPLLCGQTADGNSEQNEGPGRAFATRRRIFRALQKVELTEREKEGEGNETKVEVARALEPYSQLQILLTGPDVRVVRTCNSAGLWEKSLPAAEELRALVHRMEEIEQQNRKQLSTSADAPMASADWWAQRRALDAAIGEVAAAMQSDRVFGCWRSAMCGLLPFPCTVKLRDTAGRFLKSIASPTDMTEDIAMILAALPLTVNADDCMRNGAEEETSLLYCAAHVSDTDEYIVRDTSSMCVKCNKVLSRLSEVFAVTVNCIQLDATDILAAARTACAEALAAMCEEGSTRVDAAGHVDLAQLPRAPVYLVLDNALHVLPFEGMDVLRGGGVARVPCASFVSETLSLPPRSITVDSPVYGVVDPTGDMPKTVRRLRSLFERDGWHISIGREGPSQGQLLHELYACGAGLYVYVGHGKGEQVLGRGELYERLPDAAGFPGVMLMGCSSARMDGGERYDCYGMPYAFLHAGCPAFIGCLWHVTDGEIDRVTRRLLKIIASSGDERPGTIVEALVLARQAARLPFLTGCATVLYGTGLTL